jgi:hypothetical protein
MSKYVALCLFSGFLFACAGTPYIPGPMAYEVVKPGSKLKLSQPLTIQPYKAGVRIQFGKAVNRDSEINSWRANCRFEVYKPLPTEQIIQPEEFAITRVSTKELLVAAEHIKLASLISVVGMSDGGPNAEEMTTIFHLQSQTQPKVKQLYCQHYEKVDDSRHLMLDEIRQAVGNIFEFLLAP